MAITTSKKTLSPTVQALAAKGKAATQAQAAVNKTKAATIQAQKTPAVITQNTPKTSVAPAPAKVAIPTVTQPAIQQKSVIIQNNAAKSDLDRIINGGLGANNVDRIASIYGISPNDARSYVQQGAKTKLAQTTDPKQLNTLNKFYGDLLNPTQNIPQSTLQNAQAQQQGAVQNNNLVGQPNQQGNVMNMAANNVGTQPQAAQQPITQPNAITKPTAEQLAQWAITGGRTDLQNNLYWNSQPQEVKQAAWDIIQKQNASQQPAQEPTQEPYTATNDSLMSIVNGMNSTNTIDTYLSNDLTAYQKMINDLTTISQSQSQDIIDSTNQIIQNLQKQQTFLQQSMQQSIAEEKKSAATEKSIAKHQEENALYLNDLAAKESNDSYNTTLSIMNDNNSRYFGYLKGKYEAAGMLDSSAGMEMIAHDMTVANLGIAQVEGQKDNAQKYYLGIARQIMTDYFDQTFKIEQTKNANIASIENDTFDRISAINDSMIKSNSAKNQDILNILKETTTQKAAIQSQAFNEVMSVAKQKQDEATFKANVIQEAIQNNNADRAFEESQRQYNASYGLNVAQFQEGQRQYDQNHELALAKFDQDTIAQHIQNLQNIQLLPKDLQTQFLEPSDIISGAEYVTGQMTTDANGNEVPETVNLADKLKSIVDKVTSGKIMDAAYQCVQFCRDIVPDLPTGLNSLQDKIDKLTKSKYSIPAPDVGAVVVLDYKSKNDVGKSASQYPGHVAVVTAVDDQNQTFTVAEFNKNTGQYSTNTISMNDPSVKGYWKSPKIETANQISNRSLITDPEKKADLEIKIGNNFERYSSAYRTVERQIEVINTGYNAAVEAGLDGSSNNAPSQAVLVGFQKMLDPLSVVRETEYARSGSGQSLWSSIQGTYEKLQQGGAGVTQQELTSFYNTAQQLLQGYKGQMVNYAQRAKQQADSYGLDLNNILTPDVIDILGQSSDTSSVDDYTDNLDLSQYGITN